MLYIGSIILVLRNYVSPIAVWLKRAIKGVMSPTYLEMVLLPDDDLEDTRVVERNGGVDGELGERLYVLVREVPALQAGNI